MWSRVPSLVLAAVLALSLAACGDDPEGSGPSGPSSSDATSTGTTESPSPSVEPATGPLIKSNAYTMHLFADPGWKIQYVGTTPGAGIDSDYGAVYVTGGGIGETEVPLDESAKAAEKLAAQDDPPLKRVANVTVDGVELWVLDGRNDKIRSVRVGGHHGGYQVALHIQMPLDYPDRDALIDSMIASIEWR